MLILTKISDLTRFLSQVKISNQSIGFVPTMGALHQGHISLILASKKLCDVTICSIFVNPTQFNDKKDLEKYPRTPESDSFILEKAGCDVLFLPSIAEIYPIEKKEVFDFGYLNSVLEAKYRPGHFNGVAQVVKRLFEIVEPHKAFFGSKDYQQVMIIKALAKLLRLKIEIIACPIVRELDGLAMSSRNALLNEEERKIAALIPLLMNKAKEIALTSEINKAQQLMHDELAKIPLMKLEYYEICNANSLEPIKKFGNSNDALSLIAVFVGKIRLIDNLLIY